MGQTTVSIGVEPDCETLACLTALAVYDKDEVELEFDCTVSPYDPGRLTGPMEDSYPPEGGEVEDATVFVRQGDKRVKLTEPLADQLVQHFWRRLCEDACEQLVQEENDRW